MNMDTLNYLCIFSIDISVIIILNNLSGIYYYMSHLNYKCFNFITLCLQIFPLFCDTE